MSKEYTKRYKTFFEMSFSKHEFEHKVIVPLMRKIIKHIIKYKLTDEDFASNFKDKNLIVFLRKGNYREYWKDEIINDIKTLIVNIDESSTESSNKEAIYIEAVKDCFILMSSEKDEIGAIKDAISKYKNKDFVVQQARKYFTSSGVNSVRRLPWMIKFISFLGSIKPIKNKVLPEEELNHKIEDLFNLNAKESPLL